MLDSMHMLLFNSISIQFIIYFIKAIKAIYIREYGLRKSLKSQWLGNRNSLYTMKYTVT